MSDTSDERTSGLHRRIGELEGGLDLRDTMIAALADKVAEREALERVQFGVKLLQRIAELEAELERLRGLLEERASK